MIHILKKANIFHLLLRLGLFFLAIFLEVKKPYKRKRGKGMPPKKWFVSVELHITVDPIINQTFRPENYA